MSDLKDDLTDIHGIGDAKADDILAVLDDHDTGETDPLVAKAIALAQDGEDRAAAVYLRRAAGGE